ncbi:OsmC family protein [Muriicola marianensis]|uniref:Stress-induced protein OsmC n=1 Tax=Muriicola marianensis TaxID=1324801 RepID=A0ABQ1QUU4_9FLAO|nr:OsmC family protein [Muriicola marianensis]GGD42490.1 stress-induced protein OsmC [Muriicola marianensis]
MTSKVTYTGNLRTTCVHLRSGNEFITDAPVDNNGLGQAFSPTDTVATALASCMLTVMGIKARSWESDLDGAYAEVTKHMAADPRRIVGIDVELYMPGHFSQKNRTILEHTARTCPVLYSIHPDIEKKIEFHWGD